jgi:hypothetical protein
MPEIETEFEGSLRGDDAKKIPRREPLPDGIYDAMVMNVAMGVTKQNPPKKKISVEFQVLCEAKSKDEAGKGRRVWQDYIIQGSSDPFDGQRDRALLVQFLDAAGIEYTDKSFNTDHLLSKIVRITVRNKKGTQPDNQGRPPTDPNWDGPIFTNVWHVDTAEEISSADIV